MASDSRAISETAKTQGYLGFQGSLLNENKDFDAQCLCFFLVLLLLLNAAPRVFGATEMKEDDVKFVAGEVAHDDRVKTLLVRSL